MKTIACSVGSAPFLIALVACLTGGNSFAGVGVSPEPIRLLKARTHASVVRLQEAELWIGGAVVVTNGKDIDISTYGAMAPGSSIALRSDTHFEIGSVSKSFTGILLAWLVNTQPSVHLDDPIERYIPELEGKFTGKITLRQLAVQTSGLPPALCVGASSEAPAFCAQSKDPNDPWADTSAGDLLTFLKRFDRPDAGPYAYEYSNPGFITLGYIISKVTHKTFSHLVRDVITRPLAMNDTFGTSAGRKISDYIDGYDVIQRKTKHWEFSEVSAPTGGIISTPADMAKYLYANVNPPHSALGEAIRLSHKYNLGWDSANNRSGDETIWKDGGTSGFSSILTIDPEKKVGAFAISNMGTSYSANLAVYPIYLPWIFGTSFPEILGGSVNSQKLATYAGTFVLDGPGEPSEVAISSSGRFLRLQYGDAGTSGFDLRFQPSMKSADVFNGTHGSDGIGTYVIKYIVDSAGQPTGFQLSLGAQSGTYRRK